MQDVQYFYIRILIYCVTQCSHHPKVDPTTFGFFFPKENFWKIKRNIFLKKMKRHIPRCKKQLQTWTQSQCLNFWSPMLGAAVTTVQRILLQKTTLGTSFFRCSCLCQQCKTSFISSFRNGVLVKFDFIWILLFAFYGAYSSDNLGRGRIWLCKLPTNCIQLFRKGHHWSIIQSPPAWRVHTVPEFLSVQMDVTNISHGRVSNSKTKRNAKQTQAHI